MDGAADAAMGAWASIRGFFTPATLFLVVNLVIGTIWLTSRSHQRRRRGSGYTNAHDDDAQHHHQEPPFHHAQQQEHQYYDDHDQQQHHQYVPPPPAPAPLARTSSVLVRLRSIGLYRFRSGDFPPEYAAAPATDSRDVTFSPVPAGGDAPYERSLSEPAPAPVREQRRRAAPSRMNKSSSSETWKAEVAPAPAARVVRAPVLEEDDDVVEYTRADEFTGNSFAQQQPQAPVQHEEEEEEEEEEHYYREEYVPPLRPAPLARAPSVLDRLRSFSLSRFRSGDLAHENAAAAVDELERNQTQKQATQYSRSRSEPSREQSKKGKKQQQESAEAKMSKSSSVARKPAAAEAPEAEEGGVDARADDFINSFRKQLKLQRLNSLLNYKEMINRGA